MVVGPKIKVSQSVIPDNGLKIQQDTNAIAVLVTSSSTDSTQDAMRITRNATANSGAVALRIDSPSTTNIDAMCLDIRRSGTSQTTAPGIRVVWGHGTTTPSTTANNIIHIQCVNTNFSQPAIRVDCSSSGGNGDGTNGLIALNCSGGTNQQTGLSVDNGAPDNTATLLRVNQAGEGPGTGAGSAIITKSGTGTGVVMVVNNSGTGATFTINKTHTSTGNPIVVNNSGTSAGILINQSGNAAAININKTNAGNANCITVTNSGTGPAIVLNNTATTSAALRISTAKTPASNSDTGVTGDICWDASFFYICTATNTWIRFAKDGTF